MGKGLIANKNKTVTLDIVNYEGNAFIDAIKIIDIAHARVLDRKGRQSITAGSGDVVISHLTGESEMITRRELITNYRYLSGNKIKMARVKSNVNYTVIRYCRIPYKVILLASNFNAVLNGKRIGSGNYLVCPVTSDGNADVTKARPMSRNMFHKSFIIPMQDVIQRNINKPKNTSAKKPVLMSNRGTPNIKKPVVANNAPRKEVPTNNGNINTESRNTEATKYPFKAVARIMGMQAGKEEIIGYLIQDKKGTRKQFTVLRTMEMARDNKIENLVLVTGEGKPYLRGNGMSINQLPAVLP